MSAVDTALQDTLQRANLLMDLAVALAARDYRALRSAELALPPSVIPLSVAAAVLELRGPGPEPMGVSSAEWVPSIGDFGAPPARRVCGTCGSSWLGAGECPDAELHAGVANG